LGGRIRVAVIGAGFWGRNHARVFSEINDVELCAVVDIDVERAKQLAKRFNVPEVYGDYRRLLERGGLDAAVVCTPTATHAEIVLECLKAGCATLVEKPMASNLREAVEILDAVKSYGGRLMVGFIERFNPAVRYLYSRLLEGLIGSPIMISARRIGPWPQRISDAGVVKDVSVHDIDLTHFFFGSVPIHLYATGGAFRHTYEDYVQALLFFDDARSASLEASWISPRKKREMRIVGTDGAAHLEFLTGAVTIEKQDITYSPVIEYVEPLRSELAFFVESLHMSRRLEPGPIEGLLTLAVAEAILSSMRRRRVVTIDEVLDEWGVNKSELGPQI